METDHRFDGVTWLHRWNRDDYIHLYPLVCRGTNTYSRCVLAIFVARDSSHVLIGGGEYGFEGPVRKADETEIEALADRFRLVELKQVLETSRAKSGLLKKLGAILRRRVFRP